MALRDRLHGHRCPECGHVWEHHPDDFDSKEAFDAGHACPGCGCTEYECWTPIPPPSVAERVRKRPFGL